MGKLIINDDDFVGNATFKLDWYNCLNCQKLFGFEIGLSLTPKFQFCPYCGIGLKWDIKRRSKDGVEK